MPIIEVHLLTGRTPAQRQAFIEQVALVAMSTLDVPERAVTIVLTQVEPENWGAGTKTMADLRANPDALE